MSKFWNDESGAAAAEYVLILAIIGAGLAAAMVTFGGTISTALSKAGAAISGITY